MFSNFKLTESRAKCSNNNWNYGSFEWSHFVRSAYLFNFSVAFWAIWLSLGIAMSIKTQRFRKRSTQTISGRLCTRCQSVWMIKSHERFKLLLCITGTGWWSHQLALMLRFPFLAISQWMIRATTSWWVL